MILVTGGTGMLGAHLLMKLLQKEEKVRAIKRPKSNTEQVRKLFYYYQKNPDKLFNNIEWIDADLMDIESLNFALNGVEIVYHCAAMISFNPLEKWKMIDINVNGTANMVNAALAAGVKKFCHVSSIAALGENEDNLLIDEESFRKPNVKYSDYSISKYRSEMEVWRGISEGLNAVIVNPSVIIGAWDWEKGSSGIFKKINNGLKFYTEGITGYVDVFDVVDIMIKLTQSDISGERFIVSAENYSFKEFLFMVADALNKPRPTVAAGKWMLHIAVLIEGIKSKISGKEPLITKNSAKTAQKISKYSNKKIKETLNYEFHKIEDTIKNVAAVFKKELQAK